MNKKNNQKRYRFSSAFANPLFKTQRIEISGLYLRTCLNNNNAEIKFLYVTRTPKWIYQFHLEEITEDGEIIPIDKLAGDDMASSYSRKIKAVNKFADFYEPLFKKREVSLMFHTFTRVNYSRADIRRTLDAVKYRYESIGRKPRAYIWVLEVSNGLHIHYHLVVAINRLQVKEIPKELKFENLWGQATHVSFVKWSVRQYLKKYLSKDSARVLGFRAYGASRKFK